ncbi:unnamed protein product [Oppiella nova]|uniref:Uncharacterized protein n=1 Tax=Oppiella nova TaxID=334625 RepID=A0A7R9M5C0_9ACAR|nr:unnamed protein product [Oppiella nova]CAG2170774.1 unnamed protein product [Oppiella nova]
MLDFIKNNLPEIDSAVNSVSDSATRARILCILVEQLSLLNTVASSRPPSKLIKVTVAKLQALSKETFGSLKILKLIYDNISELDDHMMSWAEKLRDNEKLSVLYDIFKDIHHAVYDYGFYRAMAEIPFISNKTDQPLATGKFAVTSEVINWRCNLDTKRRAVKPTVCKDEASGWADWKTQTDKVVTTLVDLIPKLHALGSEYWATQHQRMLDLIRDNVSEIDTKVKSVANSSTRARILCILVEQLNLLNIVASTRAPE